MRKIILKTNLRKIEKVAGGQIVLINDIVDYHFDVLIICIIVVLIASLPLCITLLVTWQKMKANFRNFLKAIVNMRFLREIRINWSWKLTKASS